MLGLLGSGLISANARAVCISSLPPLLLRFESQINDNISFQISHRLKIES